MIQYNSRASVTAIGDFLLWRRVRNRQQLQRAYNFFSLPLVGLREAASPRADASVMHAAAGAARVTLAGDPS